jgi:hypothetical protein
VSPVKKENVFWIILSKREEYFGSKVPPRHNHYNLMKTRSQFGASNLETFVVSIEKPVHLPFVDVENNNNEKKNIGPF